MAKAPFFVVGREFLVWRLGGIQKKNICKVPEGFFCVPTGVIILAIWAESNLILKSLVIDRDFPCYNCIVSGQIIATKPPRSPPNGDFFFGNPPQNPQNSG